MVDKPESSLKEREIELLTRIEHSNRELYFCSEAHKNFGNTCRYNAWKYVVGDYVVYIDDDDYHINETFATLNREIDKLESRPAWGIFPVLRYNNIFLNIPPGSCKTCSNQIFHVPKMNEINLRYFIDGYYQADGLFIESLKEKYNYVVIDPTLPLAYIEQSNYGILPPNKGYLEDAFADYTTNYTLETETISLESSNYLWNYLYKNETKKAVDLGSGWSSFVLRYYKQLVSPDLIIYSVDTDKYWLDTTQHVLNKYGLDTSNLCLLQNFHETNFDLVFSDLGRVCERKSQIPEIISLAKQAVIFNDMHYTDYKEFLQQWADNSNNTLELLYDETLDKFGRYMGIIRL